jgi:hypothetical protein
MLCLVFYIEVIHVLILFVLCGYSTLHEMVIHYRLKYVIIFPLPLSIVNDFLILI